MNRITLFKFENFEYLYYISQFIFLLMWNKYTEILKEHSFYSISPFTGPSIEDDIVNESLRFKKHLVEVNNVKPQFSIILKPVKNYTIGEKFAILSKTTSIESDTKTLSLKASDCQDLYVDIDDKQSSQDDLSSDLLSFKSFHTSYKTNENILSSCTQHSSIIDDSPKERPKNHLKPLYNRRSKSVEKLGWAT